MTRLEFFLKYLKYVLFYLPTFALQRSGIELIYLGNYLEIAFFISMKILFMYASVSLRTYYKVLSAE